MEKGKPQFRKKFNTELPKACPNVASYFRLDIKKSCSHKEDHKVEGVANVTEPVCVCVCV